MPDYTLDQLDSRIISAAGGQWRLFVIRVISLPDNTCVAQHLIFANLNRRGDVMRKRISGTQTTASNEELAAFAGEADEREIQTTGGRMVVRRASTPTADVAWIIQLEFGAVRPTAAATDKLISDLDNADLGAMASLFNHQLSA